MQTVTLILKQNKILSNQPKLGTGEELKVIKTIGKAHILSKASTVKYSSVNKNKAIWKVFLRYRSCDIDNFRNAGERKHSYSYLANVPFTLSEPTALMT